jgi:hypothetical protein
MKALSFLFPDGILHELRAGLPGLLFVLTFVLCLYTLVYGVVQLAGGGQTAVMVTLFTVACAMLGLTEALKRRWGV